jgi:hypothetical protein
MTYIQFDGLRGGNFSEETKKIKDLSRTPFNPFLVLKSSQIVNREFRNFPVPPFMISTGMAKPFPSRTVEICYSILVQTLLEVRSDVVVFPVPSVSVQGILVPVCPAALAKVVEEQVRG